MTPYEMMLSESQERMAIVIDAKDADFIKAECAKENLEVVQVAVVTDENRLVGALPTIKYLVEKGAKVILCSHLGKPKGEPKPELSLHQ